MIKKHFYLLLILFTCSLSAKANFNYDANCVDAYKAIFSLRLKDARLLVQKEKQQNPQNGITVLLDNYIDYFTLLASENKADYGKLKENESTRISALEDNDKSSPFYLFTQAEVYMQWGMLKGKFGDYLSSSMDIKRAGNLLKDNAQKFPDFALNQKGIALVNVIFGSIPPNLKGITRFLGMSGNAATGIKQMEDLRAELPKSKYSFYRDEVIFLLCNIDIDIQHNKNNYTKLIGYINSMENNGMLKSYLQGYVAAKTVHNDEAITFLATSPKGNEYINLPLIDYLLGNAKLNRMDADAPEYLSKYLNEYRGFNYIKDTYLKLANYYLLTNEPKKYEYYIQQVRSKGYAVDEKDQQAINEATDNKPDTDLLKARFYFDGGYYAKALNQLKDNNINAFKLQRDKIEFYYRLGRIYDKTDRDIDALISYQRAINFGKDTKYYFASNAALRMANIYEQRKDFDRAANYYNQALNMKNHAYQTSTENEAKEGLKRINR
jgi:hypothetical protein